MATIIDTIYSHLKQMSQSDQKIAQTVLKAPNKTVNYTISELAEQAGVSDASVTRFCHNLHLSGFHDLKIQLAKDSSEPAMKKMPKDDLSAALAQIEENKIAEIKTTLNLAPEKVKKVLSILQNSKLIQISAEGDTYPVASDAIYKFNQIGLLAFGSENLTTSLAQTLNISSKDCLLIISNSGESAALLKQIKLAKEKKAIVIAITNRDDSPIALASDYHLKTGVRQAVLQTQYYFSRVSAFTMIEALFLLLINNDPKMVEHIKRHEEIISNQKI